ncbi:MAG: hypothetical protein HZB92_00040 [Euryarchaeota archaeon]|nr:hypothetical protein [Euryarchaeota archaeon]
MTSAELRYLLRSKGHLELKYPGKYVAISSSKVVAVGGSPSEVLSALPPKGACRPLVAYIPKPADRALGL